MKRLQEIVLASTLALASLGAATSAENTERTVERPIQVQEKNRPKDDERDVLCAYGAMFAMALAGLLSYKVFSIYCDIKDFRKAKKEGEVKSWREFKDKKAYEKAYNDCGWDTADS